MAELVNAPFTPEQVASLNDFQCAGVFHPFTCGGGGGPHGNAVLVATEEGWHCPRNGCSHRQNWAHAFMADRSWQAASRWGQP